MNCAIKHSRLEDAEGFAACVEQCDPTEGCQRACDALYGVDGLAKQTACHQFCVGELPCLSRCQEEIADGTLSPETNCTQVCRVNACNIAGAVEATVHDGTGESVDVPEPAACDPKRCLDHCVQMKSVGDLQADVRCSDYCVLPTACETSCAAQQAAGELAEGLDCQAFCGEVDCQNVCQLQIDSELLPEGTDCGAVCDVRPVNECAGYCAKVLTQDGSEMDADDAARCVAVCTKAPPAEFCEALPKEMRAGCLTDLCRGQAELGNEFASCKLTDCFDAAAVEGDADRQACIATTTDAGCARQCAGLEGGDGEECLARCQLDACTFSDTYGAAVDAHAANAYCVRSFCGSDATAECEACVDAAAQERTLALEEAGAPVDFSQQYHFCRSEFGEGLPSGGE